MKPRFRILIVLTESPARTARLASAASSGMPSLDVARLVAQLTRLGAEVRVMDQAAERISARTVRREARWWKPKLSLLHAGGEQADNNPVPDSAPFDELLSGRGLAGCVLAAGPLGRLYAVELLAKFEQLDGVFHGVPSPELLSDAPLQAPGVQTRSGALTELPCLDPQLAMLPPAWQAFALDAYPGRGGLRAVRIAADGADPEHDLAEVQHAVLRAGARFLQFEARDVGVHPKGMERVARAMFGAAPSVAWSCRVRIDHVEPVFALALARGGCQAALLVSPEPHSAPGVAPMDDPYRGRLEGAVDTLKATGIAVAVEFVIGRPGQDRAQLIAWQRWFQDRQIAVSAQVYVRHPQPEDAQAATLAESLQNAGCVDNDLRPAHIEKAVRALGWHGATLGALS